MKKLIVFLSTLILSAVTMAQMTTVTGTVVDSDGTTWANGTISVQFVPNPSYPNMSSYRIGGVALATSVTNQGPLTLSSGGAFSASVYDNSQVSPGGSQWRFTVCPLSTAQCGIYTSAVTGSSVSISTTLTATIPPPRFPAVIGNYGYADVEAQLQLVPGSIYYNVNNTCYRGYDSTLGWGCITGQLISVPVTVADGGTGSSTAAGALANLGGAALSGAAFTGPVQDGTTVLPNQVNPAAFGTVDPTGVASSTAAFLAAINTGLPIDMPAATPAGAPAVYNACGLQIPATGMQLSGPLVNNQSSAPSQIPQLICETGDMFVPASSGSQIQNLSVTNIGLMNAHGVLTTSTGGHIFNMGTSNLVNCDLEGIYSWQRNPAKSFLVTAGGVQQCIFKNDSISAADGNTAPLVQIDIPSASVNGNNTLDIEDSEFSASATSTVPAVAIDTISGCMQEVYMRNITFEAMQAGGMRFDCVQNARLEGVVNWDIPGNYDSMTNPFIYVAPGNAAGTSANVTIANSASNYGAYVPTPITGFSGTITPGSYGTLTFSTSKLYTAGRSVLLDSFTGVNTALNGQLVKVLSAGLSSSNFEAVVYEPSGVTYSSGTGTASSDMPDIVFPWGVGQLDNTLSSVTVETNTPPYAVAQTQQNYPSVDPLRDIHGAEFGVWSTEDGFSGGGMTGNLATDSDGLAAATWYAIYGGAGSAPVIVTGITDPLGGTSAVQITFAIGSGTSASDISVWQQTIAPPAGIGTYRMAVWARACSGTSTFVLKSAEGYTFPAAQTATTTWKRFYQVAYDPNATYEQPQVGLQGDLTPAAGTVCVQFYGFQLTPGSAIHPYVSTTYAGHAVPIAPGEYKNGRASISTLSGDCALASPDAITCTKSNGTALGPLATVSIATTGQGGLGANNSSASGVPVFASGTSTVTAQVGISGGSPVKATNTYGCLDGYDHTPCVVWQATTLTGQTGSSGTPNFAPAKAGLYRVTTTACITTVGTAGTVSTSVWMGLSTAYNYGPSGQTLSFTNPLGSCSVTRADGRVPVSGSSYSFGPGGNVSGNVGGQYSLDAYAEYMGP